MQGFAPFPPDRDLPLIDTHAHVYKEYYEEDYQAVLDELRRRMFRVLVPGVDLETSREAVALAHREDFVHAAAGVHPNRAKKLSREELQALEDLLCEPDVAAVGEIGLDYYHESASRETQHYMLHQLLELARDLHLPVILHVRPDDENARQPIFDDLFPIMDAHGGKGQITGVFHCFGGNDYRLTQCLDYQMFISFAGNVTYPRALERRAVARKVPMDRLLVETDAPYLAPESHREKRNRPDYIWPVYQQLADLNDWSEEFLVDKVWENTEKLFGWSPDELST